MSTVLVQSLQQGTVLSSALAWSQGSQSAAITGLMSNTDAASTSNQLTVFLSASFDPQGLSWVRQASFQWQGGFLDHSGNPVPPRMAWAPSPGQAHQPTFLRVEADVPQPLSLGFDLAIS